MPFLADDIWHILDKPIYFKGNQSPITQPRWYHVHYLMHKYTLNPDKPRKRDRPVQFKTKSTILDLLQFSWVKNRWNIVNSNRMDIRYLNGYKFVCHDKHYPKEACDVRTHYSTLFPFSSNQNCKSNGYTRGYGSSNPCAARQAFSTHKASHKAGRGWNCAFIAFQLVLRSCRTCLKFT